MRPVVIDASDALATQLRGWGRYTSELVRALRADTSDGLELAPVVGRSRGPEMVFEQVGLPLMLRRRRAALVHAPNCFLPLVRPCPGVVTIHDLAFETWPHDFAAATRAKYRTITPLAARSAQRIICPSSFTAADVCRRYRVDPAKIRVIPQAPALPRLVDGRELDPTPPPPEPYILAVGDLRAKKNQGALVTAYASLRRDGAIDHRLILAGAEAGEGARLRAMARGEPLQLTGYVDDANLDTLIAGADLLVHPSLYEGFGLVVLEAMARGTPVLAARATALPETGADAAGYFDPGDPGDLKRRLRDLLGDADHRSELAGRGRARAAQFSWAATARATAEVYRELL